MGKELGNREFGNLVRSLRQQKIFIGSDLEYRRWNQAYLAELSNLTERQVARIEQGHVQNLKPFLDGLANAFSLSEAEKVEFYAQAGYVYQVKREAKDRELLHKLFEQLHHPASARTPLWDFIAFNSYHAALWGHTEETIQLLNEGELGPNLLRVLIDPAFPHRIYAGGETKWQEDVPRSIRVFRSVSFQYGHTKRYRQILKEMKRYPDFNRFWELSERLPNNQEQSPVRPIVTIYNPTYGEMDFMSLRIPRRYLGDDVDVSIYVPLISSEDRYFQFRSTIKLNTVHFFREQPLE